MAERSVASQDLVEAIERFVTSKEEHGDKDMVFPHGVDGLLTYPGVRPDMYNLVPRVGTFASELPMFPSFEANPLYEFITGVTAQTGSNPETTCGTPPVAGKMKIAQISAPFGTFFKGIDQIKVSELGLRRNRSDVNRRLRNRFGSAGESPFVPTPPNATPESFNTPLGKAFMEFGQGVQLDVAVVDWIGDPTKLPAATQLGFIQEYRGLDAWIKTGYTDLISGNAVASLDSFVENYNATLGAQFVVDVVNMYDTLTINAELTNVPNTLWQIVVHPRMRQSLYDIWACNYHTARCIPSASNGLRLDTTEVTRLRDLMRQGEYLLINGEQVAVKFDAAIPATQSEATGVWTSDFYLVPIEDGLGNPLVYREYLPYDLSNQDVTEVIQTAGDRFRIVNGGLYLMTWSTTNFCINYVFTSKMRIILERPDLAGRQDNVQFENSTPINDPFPSRTYHRNGGTTFRDLE